MKIYPNTKIKQILNKWPGKTRFGVYRFLPVFFVFGAALEFAMINWHAGEVNFYKTYKRRRAQEIVDHEIIKQT